MANMLLTCRPLTGIYMGLHMFNFKIPDSCAVIFAVVFCMYRNSVVNGTSNFLEFKFLANVKCIHFLMRFGDVKQGVATIRFCNE